MDPVSDGWWRRHGWTIALLLTAFGISFAIRTVWSYPIVAQYGALFTYGGGSDSYYHSRVMAYIIQNHVNLIHDPMLKFPVGSINPREPLFDWMNAILGILFAPFFGGNAVAAGAWFLDLQAPLWAALGVFPVYLIGREVASRRMGLIAALIFPFLSANIDSTIFGYANYLSFYTFIILVVIYSYIRTVKSVGSRRWVESYRDPRSVLAGLKGFLRVERTAVKWAVFTGVSLGALALAWQGYTYAVVVIGVSVLVIMIVERIRRVDSFGLYIATWIVGLVGFPMAVPYYLVQQQFSVWFDLPLLLFFGVLGLLLPFLFLRDVPWVFSIPLFAGLVALAALGLRLVNPGYFTQLVTGQGYFVKTLIYSTVAEAQAPSIDQLVIGYGVVTFFLAFVGIALFLYQLVHGRFKRHHFVFLIFAILSIYLPISAAKFFLLGSPVFALLPAEAIRRALDIAGYPELRRTVASLSDRRSQFSAFRRAFKARHILVLALVVGLILPNIWVAIDAGIPGNVKNQFSSQVAATLPPWLQPNSSAGFYFGAAGSSLDTPNQYDSAGYNWLSLQDTNLPPAQRPALISWWDYGFQTIAQGDHPSVADNFQNGIAPAGQFLLAQNESQAIGVLTTTLLQAEANKTHEPYLPPALNQVLAADGLNLTELHTLLHNVTADVPLVVNHPDRYLPVNSKTLSAENAMYLAMAYFLATSLPLSGVSQVYNDVQQYTGWSIRYALVDSRLFPFTGTDTGIFYAPADLTGRVINSAGLPVTYFNVTVLASDGNEYPAGQVPAGVTPVNYFVNYFAPFYNSIIYRTYIGYNGTDVGLGTGIPGLEGSSAVVSSPIMPAWMMEHFEVVYRTAYYCAQPNATAGSSCFSAWNLPTAVETASRTGGTADTSPSSYFGGGEAMLEYYPGQTLLGEVVLPNGAPVSGARVTVADGWGIPHMTTLTAADGSFSLVLPPGNDTVNITVGSFDPLYQQDSILLKSLHLYVPNSVGLSFNAPNLVETVTLQPAAVQGFVYWNSNNTTGYAPSVDPLVPNAGVVLWGANGTKKITAVTDASGTFYLTNVPPGVYRYNLLVGGRNYTESSLTVEPGAVVNATVGLSPGHIRGTVYDPSGGLVFGATVTLSNASGVVATAVSNGTGEYAIRSTGPGNYTLLATGPAAGERSEGVPVTISGPGAVVRQNLTVRQTNPVPVAVVVNGAPASGVPVRFTPIVSFATGVSPIATLANASLNASVFTTNAAGTLTAYLPPGVYSAYALGNVGATLESAIADVAVPSAGAASEVTLGLSPAVRLAGGVVTVGTLSNTTRTAVIAYATGGGESLGWTTTNGTFALYLPSGGYTLLALTGGTSAGGSTLAALTSVTLPTATSVRLTPVGAIASRFTVGSRLPNGAIFPANSASVTVSAGPSGPAIPAVTTTNGSVLYYLPSTVPAPASSYCVSASALGFAGATTCGISPSGLEAMTSFPLELAEVRVHLSVVGLPSGTTVTVNLTAESPSAANLSLTGGPTFSFLAPPGVYGVGGWASLANGTLYLPPSSLSTTIPLGATYSNLTLYLFEEILSTGTLTLPAGGAASAVTISLASPVLEVTVNGTAFTKGFYIPSGSYSAYAAVNVSGTTYTNLSRVTVSSAGVVRGPIVLTSPGATVSGQLFDPSSHPLLLNGTAILTSPTGAVVQVPVSNGQFSSVLPPNLNFSVEFNSTGLTVGPNGSFYQSWSSTPGAACPSIPSAPVCAVRMIPTTELLYLNGSLSSPGVPGLLPGTVTFQGPYPSTNATVVTASLGRFSTLLLPGAYSVYAVSGTGAAGRAAFANVLVLPTTPSTVALSLAPTWSATVSLGPPNGTFAGLGPATLSLVDQFGHRFVFPGLTGSSTFTLSLPAGNYTLSASAQGALNGVPTPADGSARLTIMNGNAAVTVPLAYRLTASVAGTLVGTASVTLRTGGLATFSFAVRDTGNIPVTVTPVGTPAYWTFNFSFASVTLVPGAGNTSGEVRLLLPLYTLVNHPPVSLEFKAANGTVLGNVTPAPVVNVVPYYGVSVGPSTVPPEVGTNSIAVPFYVANTGNSNESVRLTVVDAPRLKSLGWSTNVTFAGKTVVTHLIPAASNETFSVQLNQSAPVFLAPGSITVSAAVVNASGAVQATTTIGVPLSTVHAKVTPTGPSLTVTGPAVGPSPPALPVWLVPLLAFVPAIALAVGVLTYRWWRTRRWTRR